MKRLILAVLISFFALLCIAPPAAIGAEGWILWQSAPINKWFIISGYPTYDLCHKDLAKEDQLLHSLGYQKVDKVGHLWAPKTTNTGLPDLEAVTGYYCLPSDFQPGRRN